MIYQCFFRADQASRFFNSPVYAPFGLEPEVNSEITSGCPELEDVSARMHLAEYGAMLHLWRNPPQDGDTWIGFTSYRQKDKVPTVIRSAAFIENQLLEYDILGWGFCRLRGLGTNQSVSIEQFSETSHPGIGLLTEKVCSLFNARIPSQYRSSSTVLFANYWVMSKEHFSKFMEWSWPMVEWCLDQRDNEPFLRSTNRGIGYLVERLFVIWYLDEDLRLKNIGVTRTLPKGGRLLPLLSRLRWYRSRLRGLIT